MSSPTSPLPARPSLVQLRKQAKELLRDYRANDRAALAREGQVLKTRHGDFAQYLAVKIRIELLDAIRAGVASPYFIVRRHSLFFRIKFAHRV